MPKPATPSPAAGSFEAFILSRKRYDTPYGDFVDDTAMLVRMGRLPKIETRDALANVVSERRGCDEARRQVAVVWRRYKTWAAKQGRPGSE